MKFISKSLQNTKDITHQVLGYLLEKHKNKNALILGLQGELGAGKTHFVKYAVEYFGIYKNITSPTFILINRYAIRNSVFDNLYHMDCYRINSAEEITALGWKEIIKNPKNIVLIEWPERIKEILPPNTILIRFKHKTKENEREILVL